MKKRILVVDDQPGIRMLLKDILASQGYLASLATDGKEALMKIEENSYDLIILDYKLPIIDGKEVLRNMEELNMDIPVILMSGMAEAIEADESSLPHVKHVISKPFDLRDLTIKIGQILC